MLLIQSINGTLTASHKRFLSTQALAKFYVDSIAATQLGYQDLQGRESGATEENRKLDLEIQSLSKVHAESVVAFLLHICHQEF